METQNKNREAKVMQPITTKKTTKKLKSYAPNFDAQSPQ
jgi:hypothetical protein